MRSLTTGTYTAAQVETALRASTGRIGCRFDVLDSNLSYVATLDQVLAAQVEMNVDRTIKGALQLRMLPDSSLVDMLFQRRIQPYFRVGMPDGGVAEFSMGVYVWNTPKRRLTAQGVEEWTVTCGDLMHILDAGGPGLTGWTINSGTYVTDAIEGVLIAAGFSDTSGVQTSTSTVGTTLTWDLVTQEGRPVTWLRILNDLSAAIGYYSPWIDLDGVPRCVAQPDLRTAPVGVSYETASTGLLEDLATDQDLGRICNRVIVRAKNAGGLYDVVSADADTLYPGHPIARGSTGFYIDRTVEDTVAASTTDLTARAQAELAQGLTMYQKAALSTLPWPAHEAFDVVGVTWTDDTEFSTEQRFHERRWTFDLFTGEMDHELRRIVSV